MTKTDNVPHLFTDNAPVHPTVVAFNVYEADFRIGFGQGWTEIEKVKTSYVFLQM